ncbi:hypothetical protein [Acetivibrio saccincola]|jgi:hypothetical protein|uniref:Uncharacterized protein n=1 Tax=Acetivibrio saccincola TaxID=1677857 RepID=A0A2K9EMI6_9FIRM|nr:hypothetical protein [Acetivibrio saccincola]AUG56660.1 hypothetical protein HVS_03560 [Acetivibrio saccincola]
MGSNHKDRIELEDALDVESDKYINKAASFKGKIEKEKAIEILDRKECKPGELPNIHVYELIKN